MKRGLTQKIEIIAMYAQRCGQLHSMAPWVEASADVVTADTPFSLDPPPPQSLKQPTMTSWTLLSLQTSWAALCNPTTLSSSLLLPPPVGMDGCCLALLQVGLPLNGSHPTNRMVTQASIMVQGVN